MNTYCPATIRLRYFVICNQKPDKSVTEDYEIIGNWNQL